MADPVHPAFLMKDVSTVSSNHRRSPSPNIITSRRGRSRSPVSRVHRSSPDGGRSHAPPTSTTADGNISQAAIAAAASAKRASPLPSPERGHVDQWPGSANGGGGDSRRGDSFECSPIGYNLSLGSFDWGPDEYRRDGRRERSRYPSPPPEMHDRYNEYRHYDRYHHQQPPHQQPYDRYGYDHRRHYESNRGAGRTSSRSTSSQPLYSEHHILSAADSGLLEDRPTYTNNNDSSYYYGRQSSNAFRDAPTPTADNSHRGSVFRGVVDEENGYESKVDEALRGVDAATTTTSENTKNKKKKKRSDKAERSTTVKKSKTMPKELLLEDTSPPVSPSTSPTAVAAASSPTNIDKELSAIGIDALDDPMNEDYLGNLSFRKSYDLEQMFSFMKSPKGSMKEGGSGMDLKFGPNLSFTNSFLMSASGEEGEIHHNNNNVPKNDLKMRRPSQLPSRRSSRSPMFASGIPTIHTLTSQNSMGLQNLSPINSFSDGMYPIVPLTSHDGMALTAMFSGSPANVPGENSAGMRPPPSYGEYVHRTERTIAQPRPRSLTPHGRTAAVSCDKRRIMSSAGPILAQPVLDVSKRVDLYVLLKRLAPAFVGFRFKLSDVDVPATYDTKAYLPSDSQLVIAKRRVDSSLCAFGGSVPRRTISFESDEMTPDQKKVKDEKAAYEKDLSSRYFMKEHCISWDVELHDVMTPEKKPPKDSSKDTMPYCAPVTPSTPNHNSAVTGMREKGKKVKYRCKLCGQPKQNHSCPYQSTVMRSIGTMVYPAVNAFVSDEPGKLAPALSEMNNFTSLLSHDMSMSTRDYRPYNNGFHVLTPDSHWSPNTPGAMSAISTPSTPGNRKRDHLLMSRTMSGVSNHDGDALFRGTMELKPEQYRRVRFKADPKGDAYQYPHIPTPYSQRKEMGDTLFALSREVPELADSCAAILRSARENDCWDQAVAELTTQVLIVLKCEEQDYALEGLKRHLLTLGIAC